MANETLITVVGNLGNDPELRFTNSGAAVANFRIATAHREKDRETGEWRDGAKTWFNCSVWRETAENVAETLQKGTRVIAQGYLKTREYEAKEGGIGKSLELEIQAIGPELSYATARVQRVGRGGSNSQAHTPASAPQGPVGADPWASPSPTAEPPF